MRKVFLVGLLLLLSGIVSAQQQSMNNDSVIRLVQAGLSEEVIISTINTSPGAYNTSVDGLIALQRAGVSEEVIAAILAKAVADAATPAANTGTVTYGSPAANTDTVTYGSPAVRQPEAWDWDSENDELEQKLRVGMKIMFGKNGRVAYGPSVGIPINNKVVIESGLLTYGENAYYYSWGVDVSGRVYVIPASVLFSVANIDADGVHIRPYVGGGVNIAIATATAYGWGYTASDSDYKVGGQVLFGAQFTPRTVPRLSFGPEFGYYRIFEGQGMLAGVTVNFNIK